MRFMTEVSGPAEPAWWRPVSKSPERPGQEQGGIESARYRIGQGRKGKEKAKASWVRKRGWRERGRFRRECVQR